MIANVLEFVGSSADGWGRLFRDPADGRFWELSYPQSDMHGGGPPLLRSVPPSEAARVFNVSSIV